VTARCDLCPQEITNSLTITCTSKAATDVTDFVCRNGYFKKFDDKTCNKCMPVENSVLLGQEDTELYLPGTTTTLVASENTRATFATTAKPRVSKSVEAGKGAPVAVPKCTAAFSRVVTCATGYYRVDNKKMRSAAAGQVFYMSDECVQCPPVANAKTVTCRGKGVSEATCKSGYALTKGNAVTSDRCDPPTVGDSGGSAASTVSVISTQTVASMVVGTVLSTAVALSVM